MSNRSIHFVISGDAKGLISASHAGVTEIEKLNKAADRMADKLGKADGGARAMAVLESAVKKLGGASQLTDQQLSMVQERLGRLQSIGAKVPQELAGIAASMERAATAGRVFGAAQGELASRAQGLAGALGPLGGALTAIGPAGLAAAAGIGALVVAGGALGAFIASAVEKAVSFGSTFQTMSDNTDVAASKLQAIAGSLGIGMDGVEAFAGGLKKLNIELLQVGAQDKFGQLGLNVQQLLAMNPEERFAAVAQAITELGTDAERAAASQELLGKSMPLATLRDFADLQEKMARSEALGLTLDDGTTAQLKDLSDAAEQLGQTWAALMIQFGAAIATTPGVIEGVRGLADAFGEANRFVKEHKDTIQTMVSFVTPLFQKLSDQIKDYVGYLREAAAFGSRFGGADPRDTDPARVAAARKAIEDAKRKAGNALSDVGKSEPKRFKTEGQLKQEAAEAARKIKEAEAAQAAWWKTQDNQKDTQDAAAISLSKWLQQLSGPSAAQVEGDLFKIGDAFTEGVGEGVEFSTAQLEKLRLKLFELKKISPEAFDKALEHNAGIGKILDMSAGTVKFADGKGGIRRDDLDADEDHRKAEATQDFIASLNIASDSLESMGRKIGGFAGGLLSLAGAAAGTMAGIKAFNANGGFAGMSNSQRLSAGASGAGELMSIWKDNRQNMSAAGGFANGAGRGAKAGAAFGPWGAAIGGIAGGLAGLFSGSGFRSMAKTAGRVLGVEMTKELAQAIDATKKRLGVGTKEAALLNISGAMDGKDPRQFGKQVQDLLRGIADQSIPAKEGMDELAKSFGAISEEAMKAGSVGDRAMVGIIKRSRELGVESPEIKAFVQQQLAGAAGGVGKFVGSFKDEKLAGGLDLFGGATDWRSAMPMAEANAKAQATIFSSVFWATVKESGIVNAADALGEPFKRLKENLSTVFGGDQLTAIFGDVEAMFGLAGNELFRGAADGAQGLKEALEGIANAGYLTTDSFTAFQQQAGAAFQQAVAGGATTQQAFQTIAPLLQSLVSASSNYGMNLDAATLAMVEQAKAAGIAFKTDSTDRLTASIDALTVALGGVPPKIEAIGQSMNSLPDISGRFAGIAAGEPAPGGGIPSFASGGYVPPRPGGTIVRVAEAGVGEYITPASGGPGGSAPGSVTVSIGEMNLTVPPGSSPDDFAARFYAALRSGALNLQAA